MPFSSWNFQNWQKLPYHKRGNHSLGEEVQILVRWYSIKSGAESPKKPTFEAIHTLNWWSRDMNSNSLQMPCNPNKVWRNSSRLTHTSDSGIEPAPEKCALQCFFLIREDLGSLSHYNDSRSQKKDQDSALHADRKFILLARSSTNILVRLVYALCHDLKECYCLEIF